jgi:hypothetical protein
VTNREYSRARGTNSLFIRRHSPVPPRAAVMARDSAIIRRSFLKRARTLVPPVARLFHRTLDRRWARPRAVCRKNPI